MTINISIDGTDGTGKTTMVKLLRQKYPYYLIEDRGILTKLTDVYDDSLPETLDADKIYIILSSDVQTCQDRIDKRGGPLDYYDSAEGIYLYRNRFIRLAIRYQTYYLDNTLQSPSETFIHIEKIIQDHKNPNLCYKLPNPDLLDIHQLPIIREGCSKIVRSVNDDYNLIQYKPTVYSHKSLREGCVAGTDIERMQMTRDIIYLTEKSMIPHAYVYVGKKYILCKKLNIDLDIPNIE